MSYKINKTDGTLLVDLIDGRTDTETTDLVLVGRNFTGYGEFFNENLIKLLENFQNIAPPANPLRGQLWYDSGEGRLKVWTGTEFKATDTTTVSSSQPQLIAGDIWIDSLRKQVYFSDGSDNPILAGPIYTASQGETGWKPITLIDTFGINRVVAKLMISGSGAALVSKEDFTAANIESNLNNLSGFSRTIKAGFNLSTVFSDFEFDGNALSTSNLLDSVGNEYSPDDFLKVNPPIDVGTGDTRNTTNALFHVKDDRGLIVGDDSDFTIRVEGTTVVARNQINGANFKLQVRQSPINRDVLTVDAANSRVGVWQSNPIYGLDINTNVRISGNLLVEGTSTALDVTTLRIEDKLIELAIPNDSTLLTDVAVDGAGISVRTTGNDKTITWGNTFNAWTLSCNVNIPDSFAYKINNTNVLTQTALGTSVLTGLGLNEIGTLIYLNVDNINLNNATISTSTFPLQIQSDGDIVVSGVSTPFVKMSGIETPGVSDSDDYVATKGYVDQSNLDRDIWLTLDITGLSDAQIALVIEDLVPGITKNPGVYAFVHCTSYSGTFTYDADTGVSKSFVAVDANGVLNQSVVGDFSFTAQTGSVVLSVTRSLKRFKVDGSNVWNFDANLVSSV